MLAVRGPVWTVTSTPDPGAASGETSALHNARHLAETAPNTRQSWGYPTIRSTIFELQQVRPTTRRQIEEWGLADRVDVVGGDFDDDLWPRGHDVVAFIRIFTTSTPEVIEGLLAKAFDSLPSDTGW